MSTQATLISLEFDKDTYQQNETITGQLLANNVTDTLGLFAAEINFNELELMLTGWSFGNGFDDGLGSFPFADDFVPGTLFLSDAADFFADEAVIAANQGTSFVLASFTFTAQSLGIHTVNLAGGAEFVDFANVNIETFGPQSASFAVVSEPLSAALMLTGLLFLRRKV